MRHGLRMRTALGGALVALALLGCNKSGIKTHPVVGKVEVRGGDPALLTESDVELVSDADEMIRPTGNIDSTGSFAIKTLYQGVIVEGAPEGNYKARIILADPTDDGVPKRTGNPVHPRYFDFNTSGLKITVPSGDYTLSLSK